MRETAKTRNAWAQALIIILLLGGLVFWGVRAANKPLDRDELKIEVSDLRSHASEGVKLAEQASPDKTTRTYFEEQTMMLADKARDAKKSLDDAKAETGLEVQHWESRHLAGQVEAELEQLSNAFARPNDSDRLKGELEKLYTQLKELEESLKQ
jgi:hypothetical protein